MSTQNVCSYGEITKNIPKLSLDTHLIRSTVTVFTRRIHVLRKILLLCMRGLLEGGFSGFTMLWITLIQIHVYYLIMIKHSFSPKMCCIFFFLNRVTNTNLMSKMLLNRDFAQAREIIQTNFFQTFGPLVSVFTIWCWFYEFLVKF